MATRESAIFRRLKAAVSDFSSLTGRPVSSKLLHDTLSEEYKDDFEVKPALGGQDDLEPPAFLKRTNKSSPAGEEIVAAANEYRAKNKPKVAKTSESILTRAEAISALNRIADAGYLRGKESITENVNRYQFFHNSRPELHVTVERLAEGYRVTGADHVLAEFDVAPGGPLKMETLPLGQDDGQGGEASVDPEQVHAVLDGAFTKTDYRVQLTVQSMPMGAGMRINAVPVMGMMPQYDQGDLQDMIESLITRTMKQNFPQLESVWRSGITGWVGQEKPRLQMFFQPRRAR